MMDLFESSGRKQPQVIVGEYLLSEQGKDYVYGYFVITAKGETFFPAETNEIPEVLIEVLKKTEEFSFYKAEEDIVSVLLKKRTIYSSISDSNIRKIICDKVFQE